MRSRLVYRPSLMGLRRERWIGWDLAAFAVQRDVVRATGVKVVELGEHVELLHDGAVASSPGG
ncbi:hypothetical protein [Actinokineospora alba]|uniref:hypothetical protein n=1 Tax=Actinokineospora alba TaxID=504798 RepID=UPI00105CD04F|nr:hypothetical protein [Actinokineospora alba]